MDYGEEAEKVNNFKEVTENQFEQYNLNFNVNFFGAGRGYEDWQ